MLLDVCFTTRYYKDAKNPLKEHRSLVMQIMIEFWIIMIYLGAVFLYVSSFLKIN